MTDGEIQNIRRDRGKLEAALREAGCGYFRGNVCRCPWHEDKHPSAGIYQTPEGIWRFTCHVCKITDDAIGVQARTMNTGSGAVLRDLTAPPSPRQKPRRYPDLESLAASIANSEGAYVYKNPDDVSRTDLVVVRQRLPDGGKKFIQFHQVPDGGFESGAPAKPWPLYNRTRLAKAEWSFVVEGEKCVHALADIGIVATTSPCGAGKSEHADWSPLSGKTVYLWPDNDEVGREHMRSVAKLIEKLDPAPTVLWVDPAFLELPAKGDVVDFLKPYADLTVEERRKAVAIVRESVAKPIAGAATELNSLFEDMIAGKWKAIDWPWPTISKMTQSLLPGTVTCICGDPGCGKSFWLLEAIWQWCEKNIKVAVYELEDDRRHHLQRALAQLSGASDLTVANWVYENPDAARGFLEKHRQEIDTLGKCIWEAPEHPPRLEELSEWVFARAVSGCRIIAIDPITAAAATDKPWIGDLQFVMKAKSVARKYGCSIILVTHPRMGKNKNPLDALAGGASYPRFAQTVLWIDRHTDRLSVTLKKAGHLDFKSSVNRSVRINKARNGVGTGAQIGYNFEGSSLRFAEQGIIIATAD